MDAGMLCSVESCTQTASRIVVTRIPWLANETIEVEVCDRHYELIGVRPARCPRCEGYDIPGMPHTIGCPEWWGSLSPEEQDDWISKGWHP